MLFRKEKLLSKAETPAESEKAPEYSGETLRTVELIDDGIKNSENLLSGLDRLAKEKIIANSEIDPHKKIGKLKLEKYDAGEFEAGNKGLWARNLIYGVKYALKGEKGEVVDTRKLKEDTKGQEYDLNVDELKKLKELGLNPEEINPKDFKTTFVEGKKGAEKIILQRKTEEEMIKAAGEIMERRLKKLEISAGAELIKNKESFDELGKDIEKVKSVLPPESLDKLVDEEANKLEIIDQQQKDLNFELETFGRPLYERRQDIVHSLFSFSFLLENFTNQGKAYQQEITNLDKAITGVKGSQELSKVLGDDIKDWEEQKAQSEANLNGLKERKEVLNGRITELKKSQTEVETALDRINNIGKTKTEKAEEEKQKREELRHRREAEREQGRRDRGQQQPDNIARQSSRAHVGQSYEEETAPTVSQNVPGQSYQADTQKPTAKKSAEPKIENNPPASAAETKQKNLENIIVRNVSQWLNLLGLNNVVGQAQAAKENNFKIGGKFDSTKFMTLGQAKQAYIQYLIDSRYGGDYLAKVKAKKEADDKFEQIIENL